MIKLSKLADYAVVILGHMTAQEQALLSATDIAQATNLPEPTVSKVLKLLTKADLLTSVRGAGGGYRLAKSPKQIQVAEIIVAVDGPIALTACIEDVGGGCDYEHCCPMKGRWDGVNAAVRSALEKVSLADMVRVDQGYSHKRQKVTAA